MVIRSRGALAAVITLVICAGLGLGAVIALAMRAHAAQAVPTVATLATPSAIPSSSPTGVPTIEPTKAPVAVAAVRRTSAPTSVPTATPAPSPTVAPTRTPSATPPPTARPSAAPTSARAVADGPSAASGIWRLSEANVQVGTIVWAGNAVARGGSIVFDVHKESIAGHPATPCERETNLHIVVASGGGPQTVPYQEVNCNGVASTGLVRVTSFSGGGAFGGSFWTGATKLGDFDANRVQ